MKLYKVVFNLGGLKWGHGRWSLPRNGKPGKWVRASCRLCFLVNKKCAHRIAVCGVGLHLATRNSVDHWRRMMTGFSGRSVRVFEAEVGKGCREYWQGGWRSKSGKVAVRRARLTHEVDPATLRRLP